MNKINADVPGKKRINSRWQRSIAIFSLLTSLLVSGCAVGPDFIKPELAVPDAWHQELTSGPTAGEEGLQAWWEGFNDPVLNNLITRAAAGNFDLTIAIERINEARALLGIAASERLPDINGTGDATRARFGEDFQAPSIDNKRTDYYYSTGLDAFWEIDLWGRISRQIEATEQNMYASIENYRDVLVILYAEVARNYIELRTLQTRLHYAEENTALQRETLKLTEDRLKAEIAPELDVEQARLNLFRTESNIPLYKQAIVTTINRLGVLLGEHPQSLHAELDAHAGIPAPPPSVSIGIPADILRQRPDIRRAERTLASQTARIGVATADLYPAFSLVGNMGFEATTDLFDSTNRYWSLGPQFRWDIFNGDRVRSRIQGADARAMQALAGYEQTVLLALEEVENAMVAFEQEGNRRAILFQSVVAAQKSADLVRTLYITGLTDFQRLLDMERDLSEQQDSLAASRGTVSQNLVRLYKALGGGWNNQPDQADLSSDNTSVEEQQNKQEQQDIQTTGRDHYSPNLTRYYNAIGGGDNQPDQADTSNNTHMEEQQ
jgi:multidrug efflux system outer membrane protein